MSNISRRKFLKSAGVAALAVAAAGVLAGCKKDDIPDVPGVTTRTAKVIFWYGTEANVIAEGEVEVGIADTSVPSIKLTLPEGVDRSFYYLKKGDCPIKSGVVYAELIQTETSKTKTVYITLWDGLKEIDIKGVKLEYEVGAYDTEFDTGLLKIPATSGWEPVNKTEPIKGATVTVNVKAIEY